MVGSQRLLMHYLVKYFFLGSIALATFSSCVEDIDSGQYDDLSLTPTLEASLLYVEASEQLINLVSGSTVFSNNFNFDAFNSDIFAERVIEGTITYIVENTTSKELEVTVELLDDSDNVLDIEVFIVQPEPTSILQREIVYGPAGRSIDIITNLSSIRVSAINLGDTTSNSSAPEPMITLKSTGKFTVRVK
jgi:hypothetical protein